MTTAPATISGEVTLPIAGEAMTVRVEVPAGETALGDLLPLLQQLTSTLVDRAVARDAAPGRTVSCRAHCGACCRQPVPVSPSEARALAALVDAMPEPRQGEVRARFAAGCATLSASGVAFSPDALARLPVDRRIQWGFDYMATGVACPFLDDESCSIYPDRPTICREYLVTTPAENCREPTPDNVRRVPIPAMVSRAITKIDRRLEDHGPLLLIESLGWAADHPAAPPTLAGPALIEAVFGALVKS